MRALRNTLAAAWLAGFAPVLAGAQAADYTPAYILKNFRPTQPGVEIDDPTEPAAVAACKVEKVPVKDKIIGFTLRDGQGQLLGASSTPTTGPASTSGATTSTASRSTARTT